ncbi:MAG TPA: iron ABC transporter permease [Kofleriaceae bacterium]|nr:iron ABC transporter permease [Kofleriaceae bacterium]
MMGGFAAAPRLRRLTPRGMVLAIGVAMIGSALILVLCPLLGADLAGELGWLDLSRVWDGITGPATSDSRIYVYSRLPRALAAMIVGAGLAAAGAGFQAVLRNPLAEPYTLGISSGAALAAVIAIRLGLDATALGTSATGLAALAGAALTLLLVWQLARVGTALPVATLLLAGLVISAMCSAATLLVQYTSSLYEINRIMRWTMGGLAWIGYGELARTAVMIGIGAVALLVTARDLNALSAGSSAAASVGVNPARTIIVTFAMGALIVGASIALAGPIGFIGLMVPHALRGLVGPDHRVLLPTSMLAGGATLVLCDTLARTVVAPAELPVGIVTALFGGPVFMAILVREKRRGRLWG